MAAASDSLPPAPWVASHASLVPAGGPVLDLACGAGRHARLFRALGHPVTAVDVDLGRLPADVADEAVAADLEGGPWPFPGRRFAGIVVVNYLWRPLFPAILAALAPGGVLLYATFAVGQERHGRPANPDFLLRDGELLALARELDLIAYEHGLMAGPAVRQHLAARRPGRYDPYSAASRGA